MVAPVNIASALSGKTRSLDRKVAADETVSPSDAADSTKMSQLLTRIVRQIAQLRRAPVLRRTDFEDFPVGSGTTHAFPHGFNGRVRWWVVDANGAAALMKNATTDAGTLVLDSAVACTITLRIEEAG